MLFAVLAGWYANVTPYRASGKLIYQNGTSAPDIGAPDERQHVNYIEFVRAEKRIPVFDPKAPDLYESYQSHQPPLFYGIAALSGLQGQTLRFLNVLIGVMTLLGLFAFGKEVTGRSEVGLGCASFALMPMFLALHGAVSNDPLLYCLLTWSLVHAIKGLQPESIARNWWIAGALFGLALCTKTSAWSLAPSLLIGSYWNARVQKADYRDRVIKPMAIALVVGAAGWVRNTALYGDPMAMRVFKEAFGGSAQASDFILAVGTVGYWTNWVSWWTSRSFIGVFGYMDIFLPNNAYLVAWAVLFVLACGWLVASKRGEKNDCVPGVMQVSLIFVAVVFGLFVMFNRTYFQGQARYLYPAVAVWAILIGGGAARVHAKWGWAIPALLFLGLNLYVLNWLPSEFAFRLNDG